MTADEERRLREGYILSVGMLTALVYQMEPPARTAVWRHIASSCELLGIESHIADYARERAKGKEGP